MKKILIQFLIAILAIVIFYFLMEKFAFSL